MIRAGGRTILYVTFAMLVMGMAHLLAQTAPLPASTTSILATPSPLVLPGTLQLTSTVNQPPVPGGVPTGTVNFYYDGQNSLGSAPLKVLPSTQAFPPATSYSSRFAEQSAPIGIISVTRGTTGSPLLATVDANSGVVTVFNLSTSLAAPTQIVSAVNGATDSIVSGYFLNNKSSGIQSFLTHSPGDVYSVFDGTTTTPANGNLSALAVTNVCEEECSNPDNEAIAVDDFDGDGYSDIAELTAGLSDTSVPDGYDPPFLAIALNVGSTNPGFLGPPNGDNVAFAVYIAPTLPTDFCPVAIATGHFTSATAAQLAVLGNNATGGICTMSNGPSTIYLYALANGALTALPNPLVLPDAYAVNLVAADLNQDGKTDLIVGEYSATGNTVPGIRTAFGNGDGSFQTPSALVALPGIPSAYNIADFNGDGYPDIAVTLANARPAILLNNGAGGFEAPTQPAGIPADDATGLAATDVNGDGLPDLVGVGTATLDILLNSAASQATLSVVSSTSSQTLPVGTHTLTGIYSGDTNFAGSASTGLSETVDQTIPTITWPAAGGMVEYGTPLTSLQNATASVAGVFIYSPATGTLPPGPNTLTATFMPTDTFDYTGATATLSVSVGTPALSSISPTSVALGSPSATITVTGLGFINGAVVSYNKSPLATTYVDQHHLTAVIPAASLLNLGGGTITVVDPGGLAATGSQTFTVSAAAPVASASAADATLTAGLQSTVTLTVNPYPVAITATATLVFTPAAPITVVDPRVVFADNSTTDVVTITPSTAPTATPFAFQAGSTAGSITVTIHLTLAGGQDITPASLAPITVTVPPAPPVLSSPTLTPSGQTLSIVIPLISSTRDMTSATFQFTPVSGKSIKTSNVTVQLTSLFQGWYGSGTSDQYGTSCIYTQSFTIDGEATDVGSVTVTLTNSNGPSEPSTVQPTAVQ